MATHTAFGRLTKGLTMTALLLLGSALLPAASAAPNAPNTPCPDNTGPWGGWVWPGYGTAFYCPGTGMWCRNIGNGFDNCWYPIDDALVPGVDLPALNVPYPVEPRATYEKAAKGLPIGH